MATPALTFREWAAKLQAQFNITQKPRPQQPCCFQPESDYLGKELDGQQRPGVPLGWKSAADFAEKSLNP
jgi:hypothetical protein